MTYRFPSGAAFELHPSNRERLVDHTSLLAFVARQRTDRGAGARVTAGIGDLALKQFLQSRLDETPRAHVLWFFLAPRDLRRFREIFCRGTHLFLRQRIKLFDAN